VDVNELSPMTIEMRLDATPDAAGRVRAAVTAALNRSLPREVVENVLMVATELVSNSVMHAGLPPGDQIAFRLRAERRIRVEVEDSGRGFGGGEPQAVDPGRDPGGRGLPIVELLSEEWGVREDDGVVVWAELARSPEGGAGVARPSAGNRPG
jgi:anti-sigma regulatory factor (Ser/Thr protein kinase)